MFSPVPRFSPTRACLSRRFCSHLEAGETLDDFLDDFPSVTREAAVRALEFAKPLVVDQLR
jgi:uncharacterized protein (DUF433 family)